MTSPRPPSAPGRSAGATSLGLLAIAIWSTTIAVSRSLTESLGPFTAGAATYLTAGVLGCGALASAGRLGAVVRGSSRAYLFGGGLLMAAYTVLLYAAVGFARTSDEVVAVTVANYLWPSLTLLLAIPILAWRARPFLLALGTLVGLAGVALAVGAEGLGGGWAAWRPRAVAAAPAAVAAALWALYSNVSRRWGASAPNGAMLLFLLGSGVALLLVRAFRGEMSVWSAKAAAELAYASAGPTLLAYVLWDTAARRGDLSIVAAFSYLIPVLSVGASAIYLGLPIRPEQWAAGGLVVAGAVLCKAGVREVDDRRSAVERR